MKKLCQLANSERVSKSMQLVEYLKSGKLVKLSKTVFRSEGLECVSFRPVSFDTPMPDANDYLKSKSMKN